MVGGYDFESHHGEMFQVPGKSAAFKLFENGYLFG